MLLRFYHPKSKSNMWRLFAFLFLTAALACASPEAEQKVRPPNILFILSDDHAYQAISAYDTSLIRTPNIDRIAKQGMLFLNASVSNSICAPSRATILTGKHSHMHGKIDNLTPFDTSQVTFPMLFQEAGYQTAMFGKLHFGNSPKGVDDFMILPGQGHYINPDFINKKGERKQIEGYVTDVITDLTLDWLAEKRNPDQPFLMMYMHKAPHRSWWPRIDKFEKYSKLQFPEPANLFDDYSERGTAAKTAEMNILDHMLLSYDCKVMPEAVKSLGVIPDPRDENFFKNNEFYRTTEEQRKGYQAIVDSITNDFVQQWPEMDDQAKMRWKHQRYLQDYLGCIESVDDNVGRVLDYLEAHGLAENTIVIYMSDQGFYLGEHGWFDKRFMYQESFKTPLMFRWPKEVKAGLKSKALVQNLDIAPTLLAAAGIDIPEDIQGQSMLPLLNGNPEKWDRDAAYYHYYEYPAEHTVKRHYGIATERFKLIHFYYDVDEWELYDLQNDPNEMHNLYYDDAYQDTIISLKVKLAEVRREYRDGPSLDKKFLNDYLKTLKR